MTLSVTLLSLKDTAAVLRAGGVAILGTDTLPGLHCLCRDAAALRRIAEIKGRSPDKPLLVLAADLDQALGMTGPLDECQEAHCRACWPGPFSLILPAGAGLPRELTAGGGTVAVRVPRVPDLVELLRLVGSPLASTSVNREGEPAAASLEQAEAFAALVDGCWRPGRDRSRGQEGNHAPLSSAVVDLTCRPPRVLREGPEQLPKVSF